MKHFTCLLMLLFCLQIQSQTRSDKYRPAWMSGDMPTQTNYTYWFKQMYGEGKTLSEARQNSTLALLGDLMKSKGFTISGSKLEKMLSVDSNKGYDETTLRNYSYNIEYAQQKLSFQSVDEYWELQSGNYVCYVLYEVANSLESVKFEPVVYTTEYGASTVLRSAIMPGWGQMHKRQMTKGITILGVEIVGITGVIVSENLYKSYRNKAQRESNSELRDSYQSKSNSWGNIRNGFIICSSAVYIYNLVDVIASKGAKKYANKDFVMQPFVDKDGSTGVLLSYTF